MSVVVNLYCFGVMNSNKLGENLTCAYLHVIDAPDTETHTLIRACGTKDL